MKPKRVVLLLGPSSAGKSTACDALHKTHGWRVTSMDDEMDIIMKERDVYFENALKSAGLFDKLAPYMSKEDVLNFAKYGRLKIKKDGQEFYTYQFHNPDLIALDLRLEKKAGFSPEEVKMLMPLFMSIAQIHKAWVNPNLEDRLFENSFNLSAPSDESVIVDVVPLQTPEETAKMIDDFNQKAEEYKQKNGEDSIEVFVVLAYCPPMKLSDRVFQRNVNAKRDQQNSNQRHWKQGFQQTSVLYGANDSASDNSNIRDTLSHADLMKVSYKHNEKKPVGLSNANPYVLSNVQLFKNAAEAAVDAKRFAKMFGITENSQDTRLAVSPKIKHDAIIDTSTGTPDELAQKVLDVTGSKIQMNKNKL